MPRCGTKTSVWLAPTTPIGLAGLAVSLLCLGSAVRSDDSIFFIKSPPESQRVREGDTVSLDCEVNDVHDVTYSWRKGGDDLDSSARLLVAGNRMVIHSVAREDDSKGYSCLATKGSSRWVIESPLAFINILWVGEEASIMLRQPASVGELSIGGTLQLECRVEGQPTATVKWFRNKLPIASDIRLLTINNLSANVSGVYSCEGENEAGTVQSQRDFLLNIAGSTGPRLLNFGQDSSSRVAKTLVRRNDTIALPCQFAGSPTVTWKKDSKNSGVFKPLQFNQRVTLGSDGSLRIMGARPSDEGAYMCSATSDSATATFVTEVTLMRIDPLLRNVSILPPPSGSGSSAPVLVKEGGSIDLRCLKATGMPAPTLRWEDPSGKVLANASQRVFTEGVQAFVQSARREEHTGNFTCVSQNPAGEQRATVAVVVTYPPTIRKHPTDVSFEEGGVGTLECEYNGLRYPITRVTWLKDSHPVNPMFAVANEESGVLKLHDVGQATEGQYACRVTTGDEQPVTSNLATVRVTPRLRFAPAPVNRVLELGTDAQIMCVARGNGRPLVRWQRIQPDNRMPSNARNSEGELSFKKVDKSDAGNYSCTASLGSETVSATIRIDVGIRPQFLKPLANLTAYVGRVASVHCSVIGDPEPATQWTIGEGMDRFVESPDTVSGVVAFSNGTLYFRNVQPEDHGKYTCLAGSNLGFVSASVHVVVKNCTGSECDHVPLAVDGLFVAADAAPKEEGLGMMQTIVIAVCSAAAYLALVVGLTVWCSVRLMRKKKLEKLRGGSDEAGKASANDYTREPLETDRLVAPSATSQTPAGKPPQQNGCHPQQLVAASLTPTHAPTTTPAIGGDPAGQHGYPRDKLQTVGMLGKGEYGDVYLARAPGLLVPTAVDSAAASSAAGAQQQPPLVYVKSLLVVDDPALRAQFVRELDFFGRLHHERVCVLMGTCPSTPAEPALMLMEYCEWGDLKQFLLATRKDSGHQLIISPPSLAHKVSLCGQVAAAMEHIAGRGLAHGDLAARNVLLQNDLAGVKVANLGLTRDVYAGEYYRPRAGPAAGAAVPLRWMAPDAFAERVGSAAVAAGSVRQPTEADDVWSFGVLLWEVLASAELPHVGRVDDELAELLEDCAEGAGTERARPELRHDFDAGAARLMTRCWAPRPCDRPTFADVVAAFAELSVESGGL